MILKTSLKSTVIALSLGMCLGNAFAKGNIHDRPISDIGVINEERIIYWLIKRGELPKNATEEQKRYALDKYTAAAKAYRMSEKEIEIEKKALANKKRRLKNDKAASKAAANTTVKVLSVLIDFPDLPYNDNRLTSGDTSMYYADYNVQHYQDLQFSTTGYAGPSNQNLLSGYQYYQAESGGTFFFTGDTYGWVTADNNAEYYGKHYTPPNSTDEENDEFPRELIKEAVAKAVAAYNIDLADYDLEDPSDIDNDGNLNEPDGYIDHVMIYHSSVGEEAGGGVLGDDAIWSHRWSVGSYTVPGTSYKLSGYTIQPIDAATGVVVHEFGHDLGLPDEYDIEYSGKGDTVARWSVMSGGSWLGSIGGTLPSGFSTYARDYFQEKFGGDWIDQLVIASTDLDAGSQTIDLVEAVNHSGATNQVKLTIPTKTINSYNGDYFYHSGSGHNLNNSLEFSVTLPSASAITLKMKAHWNIEKDWDFAQVRVNGTAIAGNHTTATNPYTGQYDGYEDAGNYLSDTSSTTDLWGLASWVDTTFDISSFSGQTVTIRFEYHTDTNTGGYGFVVDDIEIEADGSSVLTDGAESDGSVTLVGFSRPQPIALEPVNYWIQLRSANGIDQGLTGASYVPGVLMWLRNQNYADNIVAEHPGYGFLGVIDADQNQIGTQSTAVQVRDATFSLYDQSSSSGDTNLTAITTFMDSNDYSGGSQAQSGLVLDTIGLKMEVLSQESDHTAAQIRLSKEVLSLTANFSSSRNGNTVTFINSSYGGTGNLSYEWDFGDDTSSTDKNPTHTYSEGSTYTVQLTVTDENADTHVFSQEVVVGALPAAQFTVSVSDLSATFTNTSTGGFGTVTYSWDFGDGNTSTAESPSHTYTTAGSYSVVLTITDAQGNVDDLTKSVTVTAPATDSGGKSGGGGSLGWFSLILLPLFSRRFIK